jgi:hypothetical protein
MALYIHPENQELLWKIVNKNPMIQEYFMRYPPNIKETWFKQIVSAFYDKNRNNTFNTENLYEINRDTLNYMVQDVKRNVEHMQQQQMRPPAQQVPQIPLTGIPGRDDKKEEKFVSQYNQFQNEYYSMFDKKPPDSIDFREKFNDPPPISGNMEDMVQKHLRERDEELKKYAPAPFFGGQAGSIQNQGSGQGSVPLSGLIQSNSSGLIQSNSSGLIQSNSSGLFQSNSSGPGSGRLTISQDENVQLTVEEIPSCLNTFKGLKNVEPPQNGPPESTVKWLDNENANKIQALEQEIVILKNQVLQMSDKVAFLINANQEIFDFSAQRLRMNPITISGGFLFDPSSFVTSV